MLGKQLYNYKIKCLFNAVNMVCTKTTSIFVSPAFVPLVQVTFIYVLSSHTFGMYILAFFFFGECASILSIKIEVNSIK